MTTVTSDREFTDAVLSSLREVLDHVGDAEAPSGLPRDSTGVPTTGYAIVWPMPSGGTSGPLGDIHADEAFVVQITSVGRVRAQAQEVADIAKARLLTVPLQIPGRTVMGPPRIDVGTGVSRDDDTGGPPLFVAAHRYRFLTTPA